MKKLLFLFTTLLFISCSSEDEEQNLIDKLNNKVFKDNSSEQSEYDILNHIVFNKESDKLLTFFSTLIVDEEACLDYMVDLTLNGFVDLTDD